MRLTRVDRHLTVDGIPAIPVVGEVHFSRIPRVLWPLVLGQVRSLGVTVVSSYVFWNHHQPSSDRPPNFADNRDLAAFASLVRDAGLGLLLRIGPWVHGESRYGGFPDWVATGPWATRTNDPAYLAVVEQWFGAIAEQLRLADALPLTGIQIENELYDRPEHLHELKRRAQQAGLSADLWTATAWGGAQFDRAEFLPVYGGYPDTFWSRHSLGWEPRCGIHYRYHQIRDDALIGEDGRTLAAGVVDDSAQPYLTCELGAGMATSAHRRPVISAADVGALGVTKLGCGSVMQGWYMLAGGVNPVVAGRGTNESTDTGYPNELPVRDYDFQAPIGAAAQVRASAHHLRHQHRLLAILGEALACSDTVLAPANHRLRHSVRTWGQPSGPASLVFFTHHEPYADLGRLATVQLGVPGGGVVPPRPVTIESGEFGCWVTGLELGFGVRVVSADVMPIGCLEVSPTRRQWLFAQTIAASAALAVGAADGASQLIVGQRGDEPTIVTVPGDGGEVVVVLVPQSVLPDLWVLESRAYLSPAPLLQLGGALVAQVDPQSSGGTVREVTAGGVVEIATLPTLVAAPLDITVARSAPRAWVGRVELPAHGPFDRLDIDWTGNVLRVVTASHPDDRGESPGDLDALVADQFWSGTGRLTISCSLLPPACRALELRIEGYRGDELIVAGQPDTCGVSAITHLPVELVPLAAPAAVAAPAAAAAAGVGETVPAEPTLGQVAGGLAS